jgi:hypothetical protein
MSTTRARIVSLLWLQGLLSALPACTAPPTTHPRELLDESTGLTLIVVQQPTVFARARTEAAANARDYATLVAVREDRSGKYSDWLIVYRWSTVDLRFGGSAGHTPGALHLIADDRDFALQAGTPSPSLLRRRDGLFAPPNQDAVSTWYAVNAEDIRYVASAQTVSLRYSDDAYPIAYSLWKDGRPALRDWLGARTSGGVPSSR